MRTVSGNMKPLKPLLRAGNARAVVAVVLVIACCFNVFSQKPDATRGQLSNSLPDSIQTSAPVEDGSEFAITPFEFDEGIMVTAPTDTVPIVDEEDEWVRREVEFVPDPSRAVWLSALCPGLGQVYNRRYWKLPIVVGGYLGLAYATSWNNSMLADYTRAYADLTDNDPTTKSYMDFFHGNVKEENLDKTWLNNLLKQRKNYFRRNRDLCIICMVGVYLLAMVDAYVDASLAHFDISPTLSMDMTPTLIQDSRNTLPSVGLNWAVTF